MSKLHPRLLNSDARGRGRMVVAAAALLVLGLGVGVAGPAAAAPILVNTFGVLQLGTAPGCADDSELKLNASLTGGALGTNCNVTIDLNGKNLSVTRIAIAAGTTLTIKDNIGTGVLTSDATTANATFAGIRTTGATLVVSSGTVTAMAGANAAAIGGDAFGDGGNLVVNGGVVNATAAGTAAGAGIGGGTRSDGGTTTINGGTVNATSAGGAGVGGGNALNVSSGGTGGTTTVTGGTLNASSTSLGCAGIGGSRRHAGGTTTINGGTVTATGAATGAGIGGGITGDGGNVTIGDGAMVTASSPNTAIGGGTSSVSFGTLHVAGVLHVPSGILVIPDSAPGAEVTVASTGKILGGTIDPTTGAQIVGGGSIDNGGSITLSQALTTGGSPAVTVKDHHYTVSFDTHGGSAAPADVRVFAKSFTDGFRDFPSDPTKPGFTFLGWSTVNDPDGPASARVTATSTLPGSSADGTPVAVTAHALWGVAPSITGADTATGQVGQAFSYEPTSLSGAPSPQVTLTSGTLPDGLALDADTGKITGTPAVGAGGIFDLELTADNGVSPASVLGLTLTISESAFITGAATATASEGSPFTYEPTSLGGFPAATVTLTSGTLPNGLSLAASTGKITGTPTDGTAGSHPLQLTAGNGSSSAVLDVVLTVNKAGYGDLTRRSVTARLAPTTVVAGDPTTLSGRVTKSPVGSDVRVEVLNGTTWTTVGTAHTTTTAGAFSFEITAPSTTGVHVYRAVAPAVGSLKADASTSKRLTVLTRVDLTASASPTNPAVGQTFVVSGTATPARVGSAVVLQREVSGRWRTVKRAKVTAGGAFEFVPVKSTGSFTYRVTKARDRTDGPAVSDEFTVG